MTNYDEISVELDRLITQGHQDSSLRTALERKFPDLSHAEIEASLNAVVADRALKMKRRQTKPARGDAIDE